MSGVPHFFVDRSLGRRKLPRTLRDRGWELTTLAEYYGVPRDESVEDVDWLSVAGGESWPVLMKDQKIRYRAAEIEALTTSSVRAFVIVTKDLTSAEMADLYERHRNYIWEEALKPGFGFYTITRAGIRAVRI